MKYIISLNFFNQDANLTRGQMEAAVQKLPKKSIMGFELGNEVREAGAPPIGHEIGLLTVWVDRDAVLCALVKPCDKHQHL